RQLSLGSIFANPLGDYAGRLVEAVGLKGEREGGAAISDFHANFIVNVGAATARNVSRLMQRAQAAVHDQFGDLLTPEGQFVGQWDPADLLVLPQPSQRGSA